MISYLSLNLVNLDGGLLMYSLGVITCDYRYMGLIIKCTKESLKNVSITRDANGKS